jgi:hypothetical protein
MPVTRDQYYYAKDRAASGELTPTQQVRAEATVAAYEEMNGETDPRLSRHDVLEGAEVAGRNLVASILGLPGDIWSLVTGEQNRYTSEALTEVTGGDVEHESFLLSQIIAPGPGELKAAATFLPIMGIRSVKARRMLSAAQDQYRQVSRKMGELFKQDPNGRPSEEMLQLQHRAEEQLTAAEKELDIAMRADAPQRTAAAEGVRSALREPVTPVGRAMDVTPEPVGGPSVLSQRNMESSPWTAAPEGTVPSSRPPVEGQDFGYAPDATPAGTPVPHYGPDSMPRAPDQMPTTPRPPHEDPSSMQSYTYEGFSGPVQGPELPVLGPMRPLKESPLGMHHEIMGGNANWFRWRDEIVSTRSDEINKNILDFVEQRHNTLTRGQTNNIPGEPLWPSFATDEPMRAKAGTVFADPLGLGNGRQAESYDFAMRYKAMKADKSNFDSVEKYGIGREFKLPKDVVVDEKSPTGFRELVTQGRAQKTLQQREAAAAAHTADPRTRQMVDWKDGPSARPLTPEQRAELAGYEEAYKARRAERLASVGAQRTLSRLASPRLSDLQPRLQRSIDRALRRAERTGEPISEGVRRAVERANKEVLKGINEAKAVKLKALERLSPEARAAVEQKILTVPGEERFKELEYYYGHIIERSVKKATGSGNEIKMGTGGGKKVEAVSDLYDGAMSHVWNELYSNPGVWEQLARNPEIPLEHKIARFAASRASHFRGLDDQQRLMMLAKGNRTGGMVPLENFKDSTPPAPTGRVRPAGKGPDKDEGFFTEPVAFHGEWRSNKPPTKAPSKETLGNQRVLWNPITRKYEAAKAGIPAHEASVVADRNIDAGRQVNDPADFNAAGDQGQVQMDTREIDLPRVTPSFINDTDNLTAVFDFKELDDMALRALRDVPESERALVWESYMQHRTQARQLDEVFEVDPETGEEVYKFSENPYRTTDDAKDPGYYDLEGKRKPVLGAGIDAALKKGLPTDHARKRFGRALNDFNASLDDQYRSWNKAKNEVEDDSIEQAIERILMPTPVTPRARWSAAENTKGKPDTYGPDRALVYQADATPRSHPIPSGRSLHRKPNTVTREAVAMEAATAGMQQKVRTAAEIKHAKALLEGHLRKLEQRFEKAKSPKAREAILKEYRRTENNLRHVTNPERAWSDWQNDFRYGSDRPSTSTFKERLDPNDKSKVILEYVEGGKGRETSTGQPFDFDHPDGGYAAGKGYPKNKRYDAMKRRFEDKEGLSEAQRIADKLDPENATRRKRGGR